MRLSFRIAFVVLLLSTVNAARGNPLRLPTFIADIRGHTPFGPVSFYKESIRPFSFSSGVQNDLGGGNWIATFQFSGGRSPTVIGTGAVVSSGSLGLNIALGQASYVVRVSPRPGLPISLPGQAVPVVITGMTYTSIATPVGFARAHVEVDGPGVQIQEGFTSSPFHLEIVNPFSYSELFLPGAIYRVFLEAQGKAESWEAIADPVFTIDPNATFMLDGENVSFADAYFLEYSEGLIPEPSTISLFIVSLGCWIVVRRRTIQKSVRG